MILAADEPEGLTLLTALQKFPSRTVRINSIVALQLVSSIATLLSQTQQALSWVEQQARQATAKDTNAPLIPW